MLDPTVLDALLASGCTAEQIVAAVKADAAIEIARAGAKRAKDAERQRKHRGRPSRNVTVTPRDKCDPLIEEIITPVPPSLDKSNDPTPADENLVSVWNEHAADLTLPIARKLDAGRKAKARLRLKEYGEAGMHDAIRRIQASPFHCGKNDREWQATLGWLLKSAENVAKALDLPEPPKPAAPLDLVASAESTAALYRRIGRDDDAAEMEKRAAALRRSSTGPPRPIAKLLPRLATG